MHIATGGHSAGVTCSAGYVDIRRGSNVNLTTVILAPTTDRSTRGESACVIGASVNLGELARRGAKLPQVVSSPASDAAVGKEGTGVAFPTCDSGDLT